jgi:hypothetical protein
MQLPSKAAWTLGAEKPAPDAAIGTGETVPTAATAPEIPSGFQAVESSNLKSIRYSPEDGVLDVQRRDGTIYRHVMSPEEYEQFRSAPSLGKAMGQLEPSIGKVVNAGTKDEHFVPRIPVGPRTASPADANDVRILTPAEKAQLLKNSSRKIAHDRVEVRTPSSGGSQVYGGK